MNLTYWINTLNKIFEFQSLQSVFGVYLLCQKEFFFFLDNVRLHGAQHPISLWLLKRTLNRQSTGFFETKHDFETQVFYFLKSDTVLMCSEHINKLCKCWYPIRIQRRYVTHFEVFVLRRANASKERRRLTKKTLNDKRVNWGCGKPWKVMVVV